MDDPNFPYNKTVRLLRGGEEILEGDYVVTPDALAGGDTWNLVSTQIGNTSSGRRIFRIVPKFTQSQSKLSKIIVNQAARLKQLELILNDADLELDYLINKQWKGFVQVEGKMLEERLDRLRSYLKGSAKFPPEEYLKRHDWKP